MKTLPREKSVQPTAATGAVVLLVATRKGAFVLKADKTRRAWKIAGPMFFGHIVHHMVLDPRDARHLPEIYAVESVEIGR